MGFITHNGKKFNTSNKKKPIVVNKSLKNKKILTSAHIQETKVKFFKIKDKLEPQGKSSEIISIPKFEGDDFLQARLNRVNSKIRPEFKTTIQKGKLNSYIVILDKNRNEMDSTIRKFKRQGKIKDASRLQKINDKLEGNFDTGYIIPKKHRKKATKSIRKILKNH